MIRENTLEFGDLDSSAPMSSAPVALNGSASADEARALILRASSILKSLGADYARVGWMLEDAIEMLHDEELDGHVDYTAEFDVLTREFIPSIRAGLSGNGEIVERPKGKTTKRSRRTTKR